MKEFMQRLSESFVVFITRKPWLSLLAGSLLLGAIFAGFPRMTANFTHTAFFEAKDPALVRFNAFERKFGNDDAVVIVVHSPSGVFDVQTATLLRALTERMWKVPEVIRVDSLSNFQWVHAVGDEIEIEPLLPETGPFTSELLAERQKIALAHEPLPGYLVTKDAKTAIVYAHIKPGIDAPPNATLIAAESRRVVKDLAGGDHQFYLTGGPIMTDAFSAVSQKDLSTLIPALLLMVLVLLVLTFRRAGGVVLPMVVIFTTVAATLAMSGWLGFEMSSVTLSLPQVLIAVCVADAVHLMASFYSARRHGQSRQDAAAYTLSKNMLATFLTSLTTALGFASFVTAHLRPIVYFGVLAAIGTMIAWFLTYMLAGALMVVWPGKEPTHVPEGGHDHEELQRSSPRSLAWVMFISRNRTPVIAGFLLLTVVSAAFASLNVVSSNPYEYFSHGVPVREAQDFALAHLEGIAGFEVVVDSGREDGVKDPVFLNKVARLESEILKLDGINKTVSIVDILRQMNRALNGGDEREYRLPSTAPGVAQQLLLYTMGLPQGMDVNDRITIKSDALRISLISDIVNSNRAVEAARQIEALAVSKGLSAHVTGKNMLYQSMNGHVVQSFLQSMGLAVILIGLVMLASFNSVKAGLLSMIPNIVPLVVGGAALYFITGSLDIGTVLVGSVCLGIAVDNTIHIFTNYNRHMAHGDDPTTALARLFAHTGPAMASTTAILVCGFMTLAFGSFMPNVYFGLLTSVILTLGYLADVMLLPALLLAFAKPIAHRQSAEAGELPVSAMTALQR